MKSSSFLSILFLALIISLSSVVAEAGQCTFDINTLQSDCNSNISVDTNKLEGPGNINILFFEKDGCVYCKAISDYIEVLKKQYDLNVTAINVGENQENLDLFKKTLEDFKIESFGVPNIVINGKILRGETEIKDNLENEIKTCKEKGACELYSPKGTAQHVGWWQVIALAIADSLNPCALAVLLILLSAVMLRFSKKEVISYGLAYIGTIYICYLLIGIAVIFSLKLASQYLQLGTITFTLLFCVVASIFGLLNLYDFWTGGTKSEVPMSWRPIMKRIIKNVTSIWSAIIIAAIVSFFLVPCIAGPYILVSGLLHNLSWYTVLPWLMLYNLIFVIPMFVIMIIVYFGIVEIDALEDKRQNWRQYIHLFASLILILMGVILFYQLYFLSQTAFIVGLILIVIATAFILFKR